MGKEREGENLRERGRGKRGDGISGGQYMGGGGSSVRIVEIVCYCAVYAGWGW